MEWGQEVLQAGMQHGVQLVTFPANFPIAWKVANDDCVSARSSN